MKPKRKQPARSAPASRKAAVLSFFLFGLIALVIVVLLEFLDYRAGKYSFIFNQVLRLQRKAPAAERFDRDLEALLAARHLPHDILRDQAGVVHYRIDLAAPLYASLAPNLLQLVEKHGGSHLLSEVQGMKEKIVYLYQVRFDRRLTHVILLSKQLASAAVVASPGSILPPAKPPAKAKPAAAAAAEHAGTPRLAIIIDDIGYADLVSSQLHELGIPLTAAVIPDAPYAAKEAQRLRDFGLEEIIHLPMQPRDPANHHPRDQFILIDSSDAEIEVILQRAMAVVPFARGVNNHMGSLLTADQEAMRRVLGLLKERKLFFVDSKTAVDTVAHAVARALKIRTALRDVFLDDTQSYEYTSRQLQLLVDLARQNGKALGIGHPFQTTLDALRDNIRWLKQQKVEIVFVSQILE